jgi:hypothetical protein
MSDENVKEAAPVAKADKAEQTVDAAKDEAKAFVYKGEVVEASTLGTALVACEFPEVDVAAIKTAGWGGQKETKLPKLVLVNGVTESPLGKKYTSLTYLSYLSKKYPFRSVAVNVPNDFKVKKLTGKQAEKMVSAYRKFEFENLHTALGHAFFIGSDPEVFAEDAEGKVIPAFTFLGSKKEATTKTRQLRPVYWDGPQAEFQTVAGACLAYHVDSIHEGLSEVYKAAQKVNKDAKLSLKTVMEIGYDILQSAKDEHIALGCEPSENVYGLKGKQVPPRELPFRSTGGHIHFGIEGKDDEQIKQMVRALDAILGVACVSLFAKTDNPIRRQFYGQAGEYRKPKHGLEYRTLSNGWICHPMITHMVFDLARKCVVFGEKGFLKFWETTEEETVNCIQNCDVDTAHKIMERNKATLLKIFRAAYSYLTDKQLENVYHIFYDGVDSAIKNPEDIIGNWKLTGGWVLHSEAAGATCSSGVAKS